MVRLEAIITGVVQRVHYRAYVQDSATALGVVGVVQNNADGTVSVCAEAAPDTLKEFVEYLHEGSVLSQVTGVAVEWASATGQFDEFTIVAYSPNT